LEKQTLKWVGEGGGFCSVEGIGEENELEFGKFEGKNPVGGPKNNRKIASPAWNKGSNSKGQSSGGERPKEPTELDRAKE